MRVAVFGDLFVRAAILEEALRRRVGPVAGPLDVASCELSYPVTPALYSDELREFYGSEEETVALARDADLILCHMPPLSAAVLRGLPRLRAIGCTRTQPVNVNIAVASELGIPVFYALGRNAQAVAEFTVGLVVAETRNIARAHRALAGGQWRSDLYLYDNAPRELRGQTIGLIGFGAIGRLLPPMLRPLGLRVLAYDPYVDNAAFEAAGAERLTDMDKLLRESDIVSLHARVTPETLKFIGERQFRTMKRGAIFLNTARGPMVDYDALYRALADGHLGGAALETFAVEPAPADLPLLRLPNVTLTPHIAGCSKESVLYAADLVCADLAAWLTGQPTVHCYNREALAPSPAPLASSAITDGRTAR